MFRRPSFFLEKIITAQYSVRAPCVAPRKISHPPAVLPAGYDQLYPHVLFGHRLRLAVPLPGSAQTEFRGDGGDAAYGIGVRPDGDAGVLRIRGSRALCRARLDRTEVEPIFVAASNVDVAVLELKGNEAGPETHLEVVAANSQRRDATAEIEIEPDVV